MGDEVSIAVGFSLSSDWSKGWCKLSSPITGRIYVGEERYYHYQYFLSSLFSLIFRLLICTPLQWVLELAST